MAASRSTDSIDREGVGLVQRMVSRDLGWIFREQTTSDQGIDAQVEIAVHGRGTGELLALQLKSGTSHFKKLTDGWGFYYSERERTLWLNHVLPVMVLLVDLETDQVYWQQISIANERKTPTQYAVTVPLEQTLATAAEAWLLAGSGMAKRASERFEANLAVLPPQVQRLLESAGASGGDAGRAPIGATDVQVVTSRQLLALHLAEGRLNPAGTAQALLTARPTWMVSSGSWTWRALANFCASHRVMREAADALEVASGEALADGPGGGPTAGAASAASRLAIAALWLADEDDRRAYELLGRAKALGEASIALAIADTVLARDPSEAGPLSTEAVLRAGGASVADDAAAQKFLSEQATRSRDFASAVRHAERALVLEPLDTDSMAQLAQAYSRRSITSDAQADDLSRAAELLTAAVEQRRLWSGPTRELLRSLARALELLGSDRAVMRLLLPAPHGSAADREATDPALLRYVLAAAQRAGESEIVAQLVEQMGETLQDRVAQFRLGLLDLTEDEQRLLWQEELARAEGVDDWESIAQSVHRLATIGVDVLDHLDPLVAASIISSDVVRLPRALLEYRRESGRGLALLRSLASEDIGAAEHLIDFLIEEGRIEEALTACADASERFRMSGFLTRRAMLLVGHDPQGRAVDALREALQAEEGPRERLAVATRLAEIEANAGRLGQAESVLANAMRAFDPPPEGAVWNLARVQLGAAAGVRAAATLTRYQPVCRDAEQARIWAHAMSYVAWDDAIASQAISLAAQFADDPELAGGLLHHLVRTTRGVPRSSEGDEGPGEAEDATRVRDRPVDDRPTVAGELHRQAFEALSELIQQHGPAVGAQMVDTGSTEDLIDTLRDLMRESAPPDLTDLVDQISRAAMPVAMMASALGKAYTSVLVQRAAGPLVAVAASDEEHQKEIATALATRGRPVVADLSAVLVLSRLSDSDALVGEVGQILVPPTARADVHRAALEVQSLAASPGTMGWDEQSQRPVFYERTADEDQLVRRRTDGMEAVVKRAVVRDIRPTALLEEFGERTPEESWLDAIELAAQEGSALWCDDLAVRRVAGSFGVSAFSTLAMAEAVRDSRLDSVQLAGRDPDTDGASIDEAVALVARVCAELVAEFVVDVPATMEQLLAQAELDEWRCAAVGAAIARPSWWAWQQDPVAQLFAIYRAVADADPQHLPAWQSAAMTGAARSQATEQEVRDLLARLVLLGTGSDVRHEPSLEDLLMGCRNARRVAATLDGVGDPLLGLPAAQVRLFENGIPRSDQLVYAVLEAAGIWDEV